MCEKCVELDKTIEHYRKVSASIVDQRMIDGIKARIEEKQVQKAAHFILSRNRERRLVNGGSDQ